MAIELLKLLSEFDAAHDKENTVASFRTEVAAGVYLHVIYKPASRGVLAQVARRLKLPHSFEEFLAVQNGAHLFAGALSLYGAVHAGTLLDRRNPFSLPPFDIEDANGSWPIDRSRLLVIGGYQFDGSKVCLDRQDQHVELFRPTQQGWSQLPAQSWRSLDQWITQEIARLSLLFDKAGKKLADESQTVPPQKESSAVN